MLKRWICIALSKIVCNVTGMQGPWRKKVYTMIQWVAGDSAAETAIQVTYTCA
jgi:hypothetical protein